MWRVFFFSFLSICDTLFLLPNVYLIPVSVCYYKGHSASSAEAFRKKNQCIKKVIKFLNVIFLRTSISEG
jgi:hypothetical protein